MASQVIRAIETSYAGCRFRSRLEARWAVFFDHMGITWEYEAEGFELSSGERYLPDFRFPLWPGSCAEVKGSQDQLDADAPRMRKFATEAPSHLLVLGPIPRVPHPEFSHSAPVHSLIEYQAGHSMLAMFAGSPGTPIIAACLAVAPLEVQHEPLTGLRPARFIEDAYNAARSARFEHGERG
jgi:hypothetical protein